MSYMEEYAQLREGDEGGARGYRGRTGRGAVLNLTHDDIRMLPDILKNYDSITPDYKDRRWGIVYIKNYGRIEY